MKFRRGISVVVAGVLLAAAQSVGAAPASAADSYVTIISTRPATNFNQVLGTCSGFPGSTCTIALTTSATRTVDLALGMTRSWVTGKLNISSSSTVLTTVSCSKTMTTRYSRLKGYPMGKQIFYTITANGRTSGTLMAFEPAPNAMDCYLYA